MFDTLRSHYNASHETGNVKLMQTSLSFHYRMFKYCTKGLDLKLCMCMCAHRVTLWKLYIRYSFLCTFFCDITYNFALRFAYQLYVFSHSLPPAKKMEICHIVHSSLRTAVSLLQKCQTKVKELVYSERYCKEGYLVPDMIVNLAALLDMHCNLMPGSTDYSESDGIWYV